jgi:hypothetical protein
MFMAVSGKQGSDLCRRRRLRPVSAVAARIRDAIRLSPSASKTPLPVRAGDNLLASLSRKRRSVLFCFCASSSRGHPGVRKPFSPSAYTVLPTTFSCHSTAQVRSAQVLPYFRRSSVRFTWHQMLLHIGKLCTRRASLTATANLVVRSFTGRPCRHSLLEPRLVSGIPGTTVHFPLHQDWSAVTGAFMFLPIGGA